MPKLRLIVKGREAVGSLSYLTIKSVELSGSTEALEERVQAASDALENGGKHARYNASTAGKGGLIVRVYLMNILALPQAKSRAP
jgi:hypothetical protein